MNQDLIKDFKEIKCIQIQLTHIIKIPTILILHVYKRFTKNKAVFVNM